MAEIINFPKQDPENNDSFVNTVVGPTMEAIGKINKMITFKRQNISVGTEGDNIVITGKNGKKHYWYANGLQDCWVWIIPINENTVWISWTHNGHETNLKITENEDGSISIIG